MNDHTTNENARLAYWCEQVELAHDFMGKMNKYPVTECGEAMVSVR